MSGIDLKALVDGKIRSESLSRIAAMIVETASEVPMLRERVRSLLYSNNEHLERRRKAEADYNVLRDHYDQLCLDHEELEKERDELQAEREELEGQVSDLQSIIDDYTNQIVDLGGEPGGMGRMKSHERRDGDCHS